MIFTKRRKIVLVAMLLAWGILVMQFISWEHRYISIVVLAVISYFLSAWSLKEDLDGIEWIANLILPSLFLASLTLFYFLFPSNILIRLIIFILAAVGQYGILLCSNIFSVAIIRTIQLLRAAQAISLLFSLLIAFFLFNSLFSFKLLPSSNMLLVILISVPLVFQSLWVNKLDKKGWGKLILPSFYVSIALGQLAYMISHWPVNILISSLWLVSALYIILSLLHYYVSGRLFKNTIIEYIRFGVIIFVLTFLMSKWG